MPALSVYDWKEPNFDFITQQAIAGAQIRSREIAEAQSMAQKLNEMADERAYRDSQFGLRNRELDLQAQHAEMADARQQEKNEILRGRIDARGRPWGGYGAPPELPAPSGGADATSTGATGSEVLSGLTEDASPAASLVRAMNTAAAPDASGLSLNQPSPFRNTTDFAGAPLRAPSMLGAPLFPEAPLTASDGTTAPASITPPWSIDGGTADSAPNLASNPETVSLRLMAAANTAGGNGWNQGDADTGFKTATATQFGLVRDGQGGLTNDPQDAIDGAKGIPGFDPNKGAYGHNIKDPSLMGVALTPSEMKANGLDPDNPKAVVEVSANGRTMRVPIVDKLGTPGKIDLTGPLFTALGGPDDPKGSIDKLQYRIIPTGDGTPAAPKASTALNAIADQIGPDGVSRYNAVRALEISGGAKPGSAAAALVQEMAQARKGPTGPQYNPDGTISSKAPLYQTDDQGNITKIGTAPNPGPQVKFLANGMMQLGTKLFTLDANGNPVAAGTAAKPSSPVKLKFMTAQDGSVLALNPVTGETHAVDVPEGTKFGRPGTTAMSPDDIVKLAKQNGLTPATDGSNTFIQGSTGLHMVFDQARTGFKQAPAASVPKTPETARKDYRTYVANLNDAKSALDRANAGTDAAKKTRMQAQVDAAQANLDVLLRQHPGVDSGGTPSAASPAATPSPAPAATPSPSPQASPAATAGADDDLGGTVANGTFFPSNTEVRVGPDGKHTALPVLSGAQARTLLGRGFAATYIDKDSGRVFSLKAPSQQ